MPSFEHEVNVLLLKNRPEIVPEILRESCGALVPAYARLELGCPDHTTFTPKGFKSDNVTILYAADGTRLLAVLNEVQRRPDEEKPFTWPVYIAVLREQLRCPVRLLVLCPDRRTAEWSRREITVEAGGMVLRPTVCGPDEVPVIDDPEQARRLPELSVMSAASHGDNRAVLEAVQAAMDVVKSDDHQTIYNDYIMSNLSATAREYWEALMKTEAYEWQSDFAKKYVKEGEVKGEARGEVKGEVKALLAVIATRGFALTDEQHERIHSCADLDQLTTWIQRAVTATTADDIFD